MRRSKLRAALFQFGDRYIDFLQYLSMAAILLDDWISLRTWATSPFGTTSLFAYLNTMECRGMPEIRGPYRKSFSINIK